MSRAITEEHQCPWHDTLVETLGRKGTNGRFGALEDEVKEQAKELKAVKAVQLKLIIWTAIAAGGSSAAASVAFKLIAA